MGESGVDLGGSLSHMQRRVRPTPFHSRRRNPGFLLEDEAIDDSRFDFSQ